MAELLPYACLDGCCREAAATSPRLVNIRTQGARRKHPFPLVALAGHTIISFALVVLLPLQFAHRTLFREEGGFYEREAPHISFIEHRSNTIIAGDVLYKPNSYQLQRSLSSEMAEHLDSNTHTAAANNAAAISGKASTEVVTSSNRRLAALDGPSYAYYTQTNLVLCIENLTDVSRIAVLTGVMSSLGIANDQTDRLIAPSGDVAQSSVQDYCNPQGLASYIGQQWEVLIYSDEKTDKNTPAEQSASQLDEYENDPNGFLEELAQAITGAGTVTVYAEELSLRQRGYRVLFDEDQPTPAPVETNGAGNDYVSVNGTDQFWPWWSWLLFGVLTVFCICPLWYFRFRAKLPDEPYSDVAGEAREPLKGAKLPVDGSDADDEIFDPYRAGGHRTVHMLQNMESIPSGDEDAESGVSGESGGSGGALETGRGSGETGGRGSGETGGRGSGETGGDGEAPLDSDMDVVENPVVAESDTLSDTGSDLALPFAPLVASGAGAAAAAGAKCLITSSGGAGGSVSEHAAHVKDVKNIPDPKLVSVEDDLEAGTGQAAGVTAQAAGVTAQATAAVTAAAAVIAATIEGAAAAGTAMTGAAATVAAVATAAVVAGATVVAAGVAHDKEGTSADEAEKGQGIILSSQEPLEGADSTLLSPSSLVSTASAESQTSNITQKSRASSANSRTSSLRDILDMGMNESIRARRLWALSNSEKAAVQRGESMREVGRTSELQQALGKTGTFLPAIANLEDGLQQKKVSESTNDKRGSFADSEVASIIARISRSASTNSGQGMSGTGKIDKAASVKDLAAVSTSAAPPPSTSMGVTAGSAVTATATAAGSTVTGGAVADAATSTAAAGSSGAVGKSVGAMAAAAAAAGAVVVAAAGKVASARRRSSSTGGGKSREGDDHDDDISSIGEHSIGESSRSSVRSSGSDGMTSVMKRIDALPEVAGATFIPMSELLALADAELLARHAEREDGVFTRRGTTPLTVSLPDTRSAAASPPLAAKKGGSDPSTSQGPKLAIIASVGEEEGGYSDVIHSPWEDDAGDTSDAIQSSSQVPSPWEDEEAGELSDLPNSVSSRSPSPHTGVSDVEDVGKEMIWGAMSTPETSIKITPQAIAAAAAAPSPPAAAAAAALLVMAGAASPRAVETPPPEPPSPLPAAADSKWHLPPLQPTSAVIPTPTVAAAAGVAGTRGSDSVYLTHGEDSESNTSHSTTSRRPRNVTVGCHGSSQEITSATEESCAEGELLTGGMDLAAVLNTVDHFSQDLEAQGNTVSPLHVIDRLNQEASESQFGRRRYWRNTFGSSNVQTNNNPAS